MHPTPVFLPGKSHGQRSLADYSHGVTKSQARLSTQTHTHTHTHTHADTHTHTHTHTHTKWVRMNSGGVGRHDISFTLT